MLGMHIYLLYFHLELNHELGKSIYIWSYVCWVDCTCMSVISQYCRIRMSYNRNFFGVHKFSQSLKKHAYTRSLVIIVCVTCQPLSIGSSVAVHITSTFKLRHFHSWPLACYSLVVAFHDLWNIYVHAMEWVESKTGFSAFLTLRKGATHWPHTLRFPLHRIAAGNMSLIENFNVWLVHCCIAKLSLLVH